MIRRKGVERDPLVIAATQARFATNLFTQAHDELEMANELLSESSSADATLIVHLQARVTEAAAQASQNDKVKTKLAEFIP